MFVERVEINQADAEFHGKSDEEINVMIEATLFSLVALSLCAWRRSYLDSISRSTPIMFVPQSRRPSLTQAYTSAWALRP